MFKRKLNNYLIVKLAPSKVSTNAGFAIGSPDAPRVVYASDQIRAAWVVTHNVYHNHYIYL